MGLFDGLRREKKPAKAVEVKPVVEQEPEPAVEQNSATDSGLVVESDTESAVESKSEVETGTAGEQAEEPKQKSELAAEAEPIVEPASVVAPIPIIESEELVQPAETSHDEVEVSKARSFSEKRPIKYDAGATKIIAIINQKGGVGKSTTAVNLSAALGELGKQVLLIDLDPQGNTTSGLGIEKNQLEYCVYDTLLNDVAIEEITITDVCEGLDLVPATINLAGAEVELVSEMARENRLKDCVNAMRGRYDYVFIDCPPSLGLLTVNSLVAADKLIIPIQTEFYALEGVTKLLESMKRVKTRLNPELDIFGILLTMYDGRTTLSRQVASEVRNFFGEQVFETIIPRTVKLSEAPSYGIPITQYDPLGKGAQSYQKLAKEVVQRGE